MSNAAAKNERVTARLPKSVRARLQRAADLTGATLNQFLVQSALKEAETVIERETAIHLSRREAEVFFAALEQPSTPNRKLRAAVRAYRQAALDAAD